MNLSTHIKELSQILHIIEHLFEIEAAVFDDSATLVVCSKKYLEKKGSSVHKPSILEVIEKDEVSVITPGNMPSCVGCRFNGHCPAKMEILKRIMLFDKPVGVLAFSSFSDSGQEHMIRELDYFNRIIGDFADLISSFLQAPHPHDAGGSFDAYLTSLTELMPDGYVMIDRSGNILSMNQIALNAFNGYCLKSAHDLLPAALVADILSGKRVHNRIISSGTQDSFSVSAVPVAAASGEFDGAAIRLIPSAGKSLSKAKLLTSDSMFGSGIHMRSIRRQMEKIVNSPSCIFISGETGTGKSMLAKNIHYNSNRADMPFVTINCANIPETLFESELFGYEAGAFTGALKTGKRGKLELANGGTLFLDEIGEMPMNLQAKFLNVLQDYCFERVGGTESIHVNVRIISASNANIEQLIAQGQFRADLYYRLNVINMEMLPLHERMEDLPELLAAMLKKFNQRLDAHIQGFSPEVMSLFSQYRWPGNIRQLENAVEYCVNMSDGPYITVEDLPSYLLSSMQQQALSAIREEESVTIAGLLDRYGRTVEGKARTAEALGISLRTLYRKMEQLEQQKR